MRRIIRTGISIAIVLTLVILSGTSVFSHGRDEHDKDLQSVLFRSSWDSTQHSDKAESAKKAIEDAAYLTLDQFNSSGEKELKFLKDYGVPGLPKDIDEIDFSGNQYHREYTHRGWDFAYPKDMANWEVRKKILLNTSEKVFDFGLLSNRWKHSDKCDCFCELVYYVHVIGDHLEDSGYKNRGLKKELAYPHDQGIIDELLLNFPVLFANQTDSMTYKSLKLELETINGDTKELVSKKGGINSEKRFKAYHKQAEKLMDALIAYVPALLENEPFFKDVFYDSSNGKSPLSKLKIGTKITDGGKAKVQQGGSW